MLGTEAQQRAREALRSVDKSLASELERENQLRKHAEHFRDNFFAAFKFLEDETMTLQELQVQVQRSDKQQLQVQSRGRPPFVLVLDTEIAYDTRPPASGQASEPAVELASRLFAVLHPPMRGLLRHYTIFGDGSWKRTTFALSNENAYPRSAMVPRATPDVLVMEAIELLGYVCMLHATWSTLADEAQDLSLEALRDRSIIKTHLSGLGAQRR
jgi:hypothetical protein